MKPRKKNTFFTFIFSFIPGAAEMYMGFMKNGLSILTLFFVPIILTGLLYGADYICIISGIIYIAAFFHARNIATAPDEEFATFKDDYVFNEIKGENFAGFPKLNYRKWGAAILIIIGISGVWEMFNKNLLSALGVLGYSEETRRFAETILDSVPAVVFSVAMIVIGIILINGKKKELISEMADGETVDGENIDGENTNGTEK